MCQTCWSHALAVLARAGNGQRLTDALRSVCVVQGPSSKEICGDHRNAKKRPPQHPAKGHQDGREQVKHLQQHGEQPHGHHSPERHQRAPSHPNPGDQGTGDAENGPSPTTPPQHPGAHAASRETPDQAPADRAAHTTPPPPPETPRGCQTAQQPSAPPAPHQHAPHRTCGDDERSRHALHLPAQRSHSTRRQAQRLANVPVLLR